MNIHREMHIYSDIYGASYEIFYAHVNNNYLKIGSPNLLFIYCYQYFYYKINSLYLYSTFCMSGIVSSHLKKIKQKQNKMKTTETSSEDGRVRGS